jgi:hypothetical protein
MIFSFNMINVVLCHGLNVFVISKIHVEAFCGKGGWGSKSGLHACYTGPYHWAACPALLLNLVSNASIVIFISLRQSLTCGPGWPWALDSSSSAFWVPTQWN